MRVGADDCENWIRQDARPRKVVPVGDWRPAGIDRLEPAALEALRDTGNVAIGAGPGAGKTEFLAQRAAYLLQTGICPWPQKILAISYKRDAAANLGRRVSDRIPEHADRFVSMTFDAFSKGLVDRFSAALPPVWRISESYDLRLVFKADAQAFLAATSVAAPTPLQHQISALPAERFMSEVVGSWSLPEVMPSDDPLDGAEYAVRAWWYERYLRPGPAWVDFVMLNRLADLLVRTVPQLRRALQVSYPFVFVDEFQDTTSAQFSFLESAFGDGPAVTVVGDSKQRIMGWAGALPGAVKHFRESFGANSYALSWNFRSSDALVQLQHVVASKLDAHTVRSVSMAPTEVGHDAAVLWRFSSLGREAAFIADWIARDIATSQRTPADFALIVRQKAAEFEPRFRDLLAVHGINVRNDDALYDTMRLQDLLTDKTARLLLGLLRLAEEPRGLAMVWREVSATMVRIHGAAGDEVAQRRIGEALAVMISQLRAWLGDHPPAGTPADETLENLLNIAGAAVLQRFVQSSSPEEELGRITRAFAARLAAVADSSSCWSDALDRFEALDAVVLMTAHRSKGLEYHTVVFLGLDDSQWWSHRNNRAESTSTFFVGLSRAAQRLVFTTTNSRARAGDIADLFAILDQCGVSEIYHG